MAEKMMLIDLDQCVRCYACQAACLEEKGDCCQSASLGAEEEGK